MFLSRIGKFRNPNSREVEGDVERENRKRGGQNASAQICCAVPSRWIRLGTENRLIHLFVAAETQEAENMPVKHANCRRSVVRRVAAACGIPLYSYPYVWQKRLFVLGALGVPAWMSMLQAP